MPWFLRFIRLFGLSGSTKETKQTRQTNFSILPSRFLPDSSADPHPPRAAQRYGTPEVEAGS
jgi:hypothetical protein